MAVYSSKHSNELQSVLIEYNSRVFAPLFQLIELRKNPNFSVFTYYFENTHTEKLHNALDMLDVAAWLGNDWLGTPPNNIQTIKEHIANLCSSEDDQRVKLAFGVLGFLCADDESVFSGKLLQVLLKLFDLWPQGMCITNKFPLTQDH